MKESFSGDWMNCALCVLPLSVTPQDYQPPGFKEADSDTLVFEKEPVKLTMGEVATPYHHLKVHMATERQRLEQVGVRHFRSQPQVAGKQASS